MAKPGTKSKAHVSKSKHDRVPETVTYHVTYDVKPRKSKPQSVDDDADLHITEKSDERLLESPKVSVAATQPSQELTHPVTAESALPEWDIGIRTPPPEFQDARFKIDKTPASLTSTEEILTTPVETENKLPQSVTYHITYELPKPRKEWDIKVRKSKKSSRKGKSAAIDEDGSSYRRSHVGKKKQSIDEPIMVRYEVNYDLPQKHKDWDIKVKKPKKKTLASTGIPKPEAGAVEESEETAAKALSSAQEIVYQVNYNAPLVYKQWDISVKKPASRRNLVAEVPKSAYPRASPIEDISPPVTYIVDHGVPETYKQWDIKANKSKSRKKKSKHETRPSPDAPFGLKHYGDISPYDDTETPTIMIPLRKPASEAGSAVTMTYIVNHDRPSAWKEWDIKVKKPKRKAKETTGNIDLGFKPEQIEVRSSVHTIPEVQEKKKPEIKVLVEQPTPIAYEPQNEISYKPPTPPAVHLRHLGATDAEISYQPHVDVNYKVDLEQPSIALSVEGPTYQPKVEVLKSPVDQPGKTADDQYLETNLDDVIDGIGYVEKRKVKIPKFKNESKHPIVDISSTQVTVDDVASVETPEIDVYVEEPKIVIPVPEILRTEPEILLPKVDVETEENQHTVTYKINYDRPVPYREWDFKMRKTKPPHAKLKTEVSADAEKIKSDINTGRKPKTESTTVVLPHTVTYKVNYSPPAIHKEWDISAKKQRSKPSKVEVEQVEEKRHREDKSEKGENLSPEPQSVTFLVKYDLPVANPAKRGKETSRSPALSPEVEISHRPDVKVETDVQIAVPQPDVQTGAVVEKVTKKKEKEKSPKKQPQTMTFIIKYELPIAKISSAKPATSGQDDNEVHRPDDIDIVPMSEFSGEDDRLPESINVEIPAVEVIKAGRKESADKLYETVTYVVSYQLPKVVAKDKELKLRIETPQPEDGQVAETPKIKEGDDVNLALQGTGTYFHVTQPSPEVVTVAPTTGKAPAKKKMKESQKVTYCVTYDVIKKKKQSKKYDNKLSTKVGKEKSAEGAEDVTANVGVGRQDQTAVKETASIEAFVEKKILESKSGKEEHDVKILEQNLKDIEAEMEGIDLQEKDFDMRIEAERTRYSGVDNFEKNVYIGQVSSDLIVDAPEMFGDVEYREIKKQPVVEEFETISPAPAEFIGYTDDLPLNVNNVLDVAEFEENYCDAEIQSYTEPIPFGINLSTAESISSIPRLIATGEVIVEHNVAGVDDKKSTDGILQNINTTAVNEPQPNKCVIDNNTASGVELPSAGSKSASQAKPERLDNGRKETEDVQEPAQDGGSAPEASKVAVVEPSPADEQKVEVLKILVPLIQSGTLYRSASPPPPPTKVTYIVKHESPSPNRSSLDPAPQDSQPTSAQSEDDLGFSCFGRQSFRKPIKFPETVTKSGSKPVLAVQPSVRGKSDNQCILIKIAGDEAVAEPPPAFEDHKPSTRHFVVVAIDFGTTYSGYAFRFTRDSGESIHIMRQWEGGDPGALDFKTPSTLLLTPDGKFHSFGFTARNFFHDLNPEDAKRWMYFEKFKMSLHSNADLNADTEITASNGQRCSALLIFSLALKFFKDHALQELSEQSNTPLVDDDIQWIITVPAIWKSPAKQFMRRAAYQAGIASPENPTQLMISLEPEAASISVRREKFQELIPESPSRISYMRARRSLTPGRRSQTPGRRSQTPGRRSQTPERYRRHSEPRTVCAKPDLSRLELVAPEGWSSGVLQVPGSPSQIYADITVGQEVNVAGTRYMIVDCGGGTVDITVHEIQANDGTLIEIHKATGGPHGSIGVDQEFEKLLVEIFGQDFIDVFKLRRPAGWVDLMMAFESRKRATDPIRPKPLNVSLPFSFTDYHKKIKNCTVDVMINKFGDKGVTWSMQGMLRLTHEAMERLFQPTLSKIVATVDDVVSNPKVIGIKYLFLVGGFAESPMLQSALRKAFSHKLKILIPYDVSLAILKGAVSYGCDPSVVTQRKSRLTYGVAVQTPFIKGQHPKSKLVVRDGREWCSDVFDALVLTDQSVSVGETVTRHYTLIDPAVGALPGASVPSEIAIFASESRRLQFTTDSGVKKCGTLCLELPGTAVSSGVANEAPSWEKDGKKATGRDVQLAMTFGNTEITVAAIDTSTGKCIRAAIDFLNK